MPKIKLYNSLRRKKEVFKPIEGGKKVGLYTCGPTVYNYAHIGNLRTYIFEDLLRRVLEYFSYSVKHVMNITDVGHLTSDADSGEDKMLKGARREKKTVWEIAEFYTQAFMQDMQELNLLTPKIICKATDHIQEQIDLIKKLDKNGFVYQNGGNVYFDSSKLSDYGKLYGLDLKKNSGKEKARVEEDKNKKNKHDFVLWFTKSKFQDQEMKWESPYGKGYPGWHIECSAMASKYLGKEFDIHCGGIDHIQVHHTNEIAQSEAAFFRGKKKINKDWVNFWMHGEFLVVGDSEKMSKSKDNFLTLAVLAKKGFEGLDYRYFCLGANYRKPLSFSFEALEGAKMARQRLQEKVWNFKKEGSGISLAKIGRKNLSDFASEHLEKFEHAIADDLNLSKALAVSWELVKDNDVSPGEKYALLIKFDKILGLNLGKEEIKVKVPKKVLILAKEREIARKEKNWKKSDQLREKIQALGYEINDLKTGFEINLKKE